MPEIIEEKKQRKKSKKQLIPVAICSRILQKHCERVSNEASMELSKVLEEIVEELSVRASNFMKHAKRKTVKAIDIKEAKKIDKQ